MKVSLNLILLEEIIYLLIYTLVYFSGENCQKFDITNNLFNYVDWYS